MNYTKSTALEIDRVAKSIRVSRVFNAPPERLWRIHTEAALIPKWWGPRNVTTIVDKLDVRVGGVWRFIQKDANGNEFAFSGEFKVVEPTRKLVQTFEFEMMPGHVVTDTIHFEAQPGGKTKVSTTSAYASVEDLEGMLQSGMEGGANESWDRAEDLLATLV
jgi:uncharacterized protein YndB with AHSA1/START domain